jgi:hypothetical protein
LELGRKLVRNVTGQGSKRAMSLTIEQMREKLLEWNPLWNVGRLMDEQVIIIYNKERSAIVKKLLEKYSN